MLHAQDTNPLVNYPNELEEQLRTSKILLRTFVVLLIIALGLGFLTDSYGGPIWSITVAWIPITLVVGNIADKLRAKRVY